MRLPRRPRDCSCSSGWNASQSPKCSVREMRSSLGSARVFWRSMCDRSARSGSCMRGTGLNPALHRTSSPDAFPPVPPGSGKSALKGSAVRSRRLFERGSFGGEHHVPGGGWAVGYPGSSTGAALCVTMRTCTSVLWAPSRRGSSGSWIGFVACHGAAMKLRWAEIVGSMPVPLHRPQWTFRWLRG
jgi:hypothetical protein